MHVRMEGFSRWGFFAADHGSKLDPKATFPPLPPWCYQVISVYCKGCRLLATV